MKVLPTLESSENSLDMALNQIILGEVINCDQVHAEIPSLMTTNECIKNFYLV